LTLYPTLKLHCFKTSLQLFIPNPSNAASDQQFNCQDSTIPIHYFPFNLYSSIAITPILIQINNSNAKDYQFPYAIPNFNAKQSNIFYFIDIYINLYSKEKPPQIFIPIISIYYFSRTINPIPFLDIILKPL